MLTYIGPYIKIYTKKNAKPAKIKNFCIIKVSLRNCYILIPDNDLDSSTLDGSFSDYKNLSKILPNDEIVAFSLNNVDLLLKLQETHGERYVSCRYGVVQEIE